MRWRRVADRSVEGVDRTGRLCVVFAGLGCTWSWVSARYVFPRLIEGRLSFQGTAFSISRISLEGFALQFLLRLSGKVCITQDIGTLTLSLFPRFSATRERLGSSGRYVFPQLIKG